VAVALRRPVVSLLGFSNPRRTGPYREYHDLIVSAYGDEWTGGKLATDRRPGRMPAISVDDALAAVQRWRDRYAR
jgi:heptosyltransferase I